MIRIKVFKVIQVMTTCGAPIAIAESMRASRALNEV